MGSTGTTPTQRALRPRVAAATVILRRLTTPGRRSIAAAIAEPLTAESSAPGATSAIG